MEDREGVHVADAANARSNRIPSFANRSNLGVRTSPAPYAPQSDHVKSSAMNTTTWGVRALACTVHPAASRANARRGIRMVRLSRTRPRASTPLKAPRVPRPSRPCLFPLAAPGYLIQCGVEHLGASDHLRPEARPPLHSSGRIVVTAERLTRRTSRTSLPLHQQPANSAPTPPALRECTPDQQA